MEQANKKFLASHILFGFGKQRRETETTALTEPQAKRHAHQATGQVVVGIGATTWSILVIKVRSVVRSYPFLNPR